MSRKKSRLVHVRLKIPEAEMEMVKMLVDMGLYVSVSDCIRTAVKLLIRQDLALLESVKLRGHVKKEALKEERGEQIVGA